MSWRIRKEGGRQLATDGTFFIKDDFIKMDKNFKKYCEKKGSNIALKNSLQLSLLNAGKGFTGVPRQWPSV